MKKFLSLVLSLTMMLSLVTVNSSAKEFTDNGDITYSEAVDVISEIGVVDGYTYGSFNPQGGLTRGAAAKIICNLILGPTTADALNATSAPFSDVPTTNEFPATSPTALSRASSAATRTALSVPPPA